MEIKQVKSKFMMGKFDQNTYVILGKKDAVIIDAGAELEDVIETVQNKNVKAILITHMHFDHIFNIEKYAEHFNCDIYMCKGAEERLQNHILNGSVMIRKEIIFSINNKLITHYINELEIGEFKFKIYFTPGHTSDCVCILLNDCLFTGDTIFEDAIGRCDLADSSTNNMIESLKLIKNLDYKIAYPGHYNHCDKKQIDRTIDFYI